MTQQLYEAWEYYFQIENDWRVGSWIIGTDYMRASHQTRDYQEVRSVSGEVIGDVRTQISTFFQTFSCLQVILEVEYLVYLLEKIR